MLVIVPAVTVLASCGGMMQQAEMPPPMTMATAEPPPAPVAPAPLPATPPPMAPMAMAPMPTPGIAARERFQLAINSLQQGDSPKAAVELRAYLAEVPNSTPARNLLAQIETPLEMLYPAESFNVQLQQSETLSSLAGIYLGDVLAFYGLARYNMIQNPARVSVGQTIRIPSTPATLAAQANRASMASMQASVAPMPMPAAPPAAAAPAPAAPPPVVASAQPPAPPARPAPPRDPWISIRENVAAGRFDAAIMDAEAAQVRPNAAQAVVLASAYAGNAKAVQAMNAMEAATQALRAGQLYLETANRPQDALAPLELAVMLAPTDNRAQMLLATAKTRVSDGYYRDGVAAFQRQDLDGAIAAWDRALAVDPNHRNAQLNRAQAIELKQNLQRLK
jgi:Tfp pilus assembly protein PilF